MNSKSLLILDENTPSSVNTSIYTVPAFFINGVLHLNSV
jgi:hypothetical protein